MNMQTGQPPAPRNQDPAQLPAKEQLKALTEQSQTALENTMLKQTLTEYIKDTAERFSPASGSSLPTRQKNDRNDAKRDVFIKQNVYRQHRQKRRSYDR
jgi:hypothetical protein